MAGSFACCETIGGIISSLVFSWVKHWRYASLYCILLPFALVLIGFIFLYEDTPMSLLRTKNVEKICASLNRIGRINKGEDNLVSEAEIQEYLQQEEEREKVKESVSILDICRH